VVMTVKLRARNGIFVLDTNDRLFTEVGKD
jgi:hypothetical protein